MIIINVMTQTNKEVVDKNQENRGRKVKIYTPQESLRFISNLIAN